MDKCFFLKSVHSKKTVARQVMRCSSNYVYVLNYGQFEYITSKMVFFKHCFFKKIDLSWQPIKSFTYLVLSCKIKKVTKRSVWPNFYCLVRPKWQNTEIFSLLNAIAYFKMATLEILSLTERWNSFVEIISDKCTLKSLLSVLFY